MNTSPDTAQFVAEADAEISQIRAELTKLHRRLRRRLRDLRDLRIKATPYLSPETTFDTFLAERITLRPDAPTIRQSAIKPVYRAWCAQHSLAPESSNQARRAALLRLGAIPGMTSGCATWKNVAITPRIRG